MTKTIDKMTKEELEALGYRQFMIREQARQAITEAEQNIIAIQTELQKRSMQQNEEEK